MCALICTLSIEIAPQEYPWVTSARVTVRVNPWERMVVDGKEHNHAFVMVPTLERFAEVCGTQAEHPSLVQVVIALD